MRATDEEKENTTRERSSFENTLISLKPLSQRTNLPSDSATVPQKELIEAASADATIKANRELSSPDASTSKRAKVSSGAASSPEGEPATAARLVSMSGLQLRRAQDAVDICQEAALVLEESRKQKLTKLRVMMLSDKATKPTRGSSKAAGYDLSSAEDIVIPARGRGVVKTDLSIAIPEGTYARIAPRSGLAVKKGIDTGAGVIDEDYRGPVGVVLFNNSDDEFPVKQGDRIAQMILERILTPDVECVDSLDETARGANGYGSTGVAAAP